MFEIYELIDYDFFLETPKGLAFIGIDYLIQEIWGIYEESIVTFYHTCTYFLQ